MMAGNVFTVSILFGVLVSLAGVSAFSRPEVRDDDPLSSTHSVFKTRNSDAAISSTTRSTGLRLLPAYPTPIRRLSPSPSALAMINHQSVKQMSRRRLPDGIGRPYWHTYYPGNGQPDRSVVTPRARLLAHRPIIMAARRRPLFAPFARRAGKGYFQGYRGAYRPFMFHGYPMSFYPIPMARPPRQQPLATPTPPNNREPDHVHAHEPHPHDDSMHNEA